MPPLTGHCGGDGGGGAAAPAPPLPPPFPPRTLATCDDEVSALSAHASLLAAADDSGAVTLVDTGGRRSARVLRRGGHTSLATAVLLGSGAAFSGGCDARLLAWDAAGAVREPAGEVALPAALAECRAARRCGACGAPAAPSACSRCKRAAYCDRECQARAWAAHKGACRVAAAAGAAAAVAAAAGGGGGGGREGAAAASADDDDGPPPNVNPPWVYALAWVPGPAPNPRVVAVHTAPPFSHFAAAVGDGAVAVFAAASGGRGPPTLQWVEPRAHPAGACALALVPRPAPGARPLLVTAGREGAVRWWAWGEGGGGGGGGGDGGAWAHGRVDARGRRVRKVNWLAGSPAAGGTLALADTSNLVTLFSVAGL